MQLAFKGGATDRRPRVRVLRSPHGGTSHGAEAKATIDAPIVETVALPVRSSTAAGSRMQLTVASQGIVALGNDE